MPPAVFTSSSGGDIGGGLKFTRFTGPLRAGYSSGDPGGQTMSPTVLPGGSAAIPMYSFVNQTNSGLYLSAAGTSAADVRMSLVGGDVVACQLTSAGSSIPQFAVVSTAANLIAAGGGVTTSGVISGYLFISQTSAGTFTTSSAGTQAAGPSTQTAGTAAVVYDAVAKRFGVFSTVQNAWFWTAVMTSG
jgi:hypothetical protein